MQHAVINSAHMLPCQWQRANSAFVIFIVADTKPHMLTVWWMKYVMLQNIWPLKVFAIFGDEYQYI